MITYITYSLLPLEILAITYSGYLVGSWCDDKEGKAVGGTIGAIIGCILVFASFILGASSGAGGRPETPNIEGMLGLNIGSVLTLIVIVTIDYAKKTIDLKKTIDAQVEKELKKRKMENDIFLKKEGLL